MRNLIFKNLIIAAGVIIICIFSVYAFADKIYLKNGRTMEGIVEKEDDVSVTINLGFGRIKIQRDEVDHIERYDASKQSKMEAKWRDKYFMRPEYTPPSLKDVADKFKHLLVLRNKAVVAQSNIDNLNGRIAKMEDEIKNLKERLHRVDNVIARMKAEKDIKEYNQRIVEHNSLVAQINTTVQELRTLIGKRSALEKDISEYIGYMDKFKHLLDDKESVLNPSDRDEKAFCRKMREKLEGLDDEFEHHKVAYTPQSGGVVVDALLNERLRVPLLVDTGADVVVISPEVAQRLGVPFKTSKLRIQVTLADGRKVSAYPFYLDSVRVSDAVVKKVMAAVILDSSPLQGETGLLGMSFLEHFRVIIDGKTNQVILTEFTP